MSNATIVSATSPVSGRVRAYFAPVNRGAGMPTLFDPAQSGSFALDAPPAPWIDLGWVSGFTRKAGTKTGALRSGAPAIVQTQVRTEVEATVALEFESWGKLQLAVASSSEQMNLLATATGASANGSGGHAGNAVALQGTDSSATTLDVGANAAAGFTVGSLVAVDVDYIGQLGYVGSGAASAYVASPTSVNSDINYVRRVTLNVGRVVAVSGGILTLGAPLLAGAPAVGMQVSLLSGFCDREGGRFFQEWSALFVVDGEQGDRILYYYPRLQAMQGATEVLSPLVGAAAGLAAPLERIRLAAAFRSLPVTDANDGASVLCFRSYLPGPMRAV